MRTSVVIVVIVFLLAILFLLNNKKENFGQNNKTINLYYTNWCGYSQKFFPIWTQLKNELSDKISFNDINCEKEKCDGIRGYPSLSITSNGNKIMFPDNQDRSYDSVKSFILNN